MLIVNLLALIYAGIMFFSHLPYTLSALWELAVNGWGNVNLQWDILAIVPPILQIASIPAFLCLTVMLVVNICKKQRKLYIALDISLIALLLISAVVVDLCLFAL